MLKIHWNTLKIFLFGQLLSSREVTLSPENLGNTSYFEDWGLTLVAYKKSILRKNHIVSETVARSCPVNKVLLKILQKSLENTVDFCEFFKNALKHVYHAQGYLART